VSAPTRAGIGKLLENDQKMAIAKSVRDLEVYRLAFDTAMEIYSITHCCPSYVILSEAKDLKI
jgi:hypothetical protein